jgi:hypothetical protein
MNPTFGNAAHKQYTNTCTVYDAPFQTSKQAEAIPEKADMDDPEPDYGIDEEVSY